MGKESVKKEKHPKIKIVEDTRTLLQIVPGKPSYGLKSGRSSSGMFQGSGAGEGKPSSSRSTLSTDGLSRILHGQDRQRSYKEKGTKTRVFKRRTPISFEMYFEPENYRFYLSVPTASAKSVAEHFKRAWPGSGVKVEEDDYIEVFEEYPSSYCEIRMDKYYFFPLKIQSGEPLNSLINVAKGLKSGEKMMFQTMMIPLKTDWQIKARELIKEYEETGVATRGSGLDTVLKVAEDEITEILDILTGSLLGLAPKEEKKKTTKPGVGDMEAIRRKTNESAFKCMMRVFVTAENQSRRNELLNEISNALRVVEGMNVLKPSPIRFYVPQDIARRYTGGLQEMAFNNNVLTISEIAGLLQAPDGSTLERNPQIKRSDQQEIMPPDEMFKGVVPVAVINPLDPKILYLNHRDPERYITTKMIVGAPGSGKTTYLQMLINRFYALRQTVFIFDIIKQCEFTREVEEALDPDSYRVWDFSSENFYNHFSFNFCEMYRDFNEDHYMNRQVVADLIGKFIRTFLDAMNGKDSKMTTRMNRYIDNIAQLVFVHKDQTLNDFINALRLYDKRQEYIAKANAAPLDKFGQPLVSKEVIEDLKTLDIYDESKDEWLTNEEKIDGILTRVHVLRSDPRIRRMLENKPNTDYDLQHIIENPQIIMLRAPQQTNPVTGEYGFSPEVRAMITAFITFKMWLIKESLGIEGEEDLVENLLGEQVKRKDLHMVHLVYDEVHQIPETLEMLAIHLKEFRKFRLGAIFTCHGFSSFSKGVMTALGELGAAYYMLSPVDHKVVDELKGTFGMLDPNDIKNMERYHVAAHIPSGDNTYIDIIGRAPGKIKDFLALEKEIGTPKVEKKKKNRKQTPAQRLFSQLEGIGFRIDKTEDAPIDKIINFLPKLFAKQPKGFEEAVSESNTALAQLALTEEIAEYNEMELDVISEGEFNTVETEEVEIPLVQVKGSAAKWWSKYAKINTSSKDSKKVTTPQIIEKDTVNIELETMPIIQPSYENNPFVQRAKAQAAKIQAQKKKVVDVETKKQEVQTLILEEKMEDKVPCGIIRLHQEDSIMEAEDECAVPTTLQIVGNQKIKIEKIEKEEKMPFKPVDVIDWSGFFSK